MKINDYRIDRKSNPLLLYIGIAMIVINLILHFSFKEVDLTNPLALASKDILVVFYIQISLLLIRICMAIVAFVVAKRLMRSGIFWGILVFLIPPISLIILGLLDVKIDDGLKTTFDRHRTNYFAEANKIRNESKRNRYSENDLREKLDKCKQKHQDALIRALEARKTEIENTKTNDWMNDTSRCPACGARISEHDQMCPSCKLNLSNE